MGYLKTTIFAVSWGMSGRWIIRGMTIVRIAVLARILNPVQFGIFGISTLVLGFIEIFTETWINVFLVQEKNKIDRFVNTAWVISIIRGTIIGALIFFGAKFTSQFFNSPGSYSSLQLIALVPFIRGFINPSEIQLQKDLLFKKEFKFKTILFFSDLLFSSVIALSTRQASSLVWGMLISALFEVVLSFILFDPRPRLLFNRQVAGEILGRSKWIAAAGILNYVYQNGDNIVVGKMLGEAPLGLYGNAYKISSLPISEISDVISRVTFPVFVKISHESDRLKKAFFQTTILVSGASIVLGIAIYIFAQQAVTVVLGPRWLLAVPVLKVLSLYGIAKSITNSFFPLFLATKRQSFVTWITLSNVLGLGLTIVPFIHWWGIVGAGWAATFGAVISVPIACFFLLKLFRDKGFANV